MCDLDHARLNHGALQGIGGLHARYDKDAPLIRKLDRVGSEIDKNLSQSGKSTLNSDWYLGRDFDPKLDVRITGTNVEQLLYVGEKVKGRERNSFNIHATGFDFREVEDVAR